MAVSYVSQVIQDTPYILPVDLNLLGRVNQYKQTMFYQNASALKQQMAQLKNTDILNPEQQQRLQQGYNQVVNRVNEAGAVDFSDLSVVNSIEGLGSQIYNDSYIMNGISSTKQVRKLQSIYEKIKTDPKLVKNYSVANEWHDNQFVTDYVTGGIDAKYTGSGTPTLYLGNTFDYLTKRIKDIKPNIETRFNQSGNPYYFDVETGTVLDETRVNDLMQAALTPEWRNQMMIEGAFNGRGVSNDDIKREVGFRHSNDIETARLNIKRLEDLIATSPKVEQQQAYRAQIDNQTRYIKDAEDRYTERLSSIDNTLSSREGRQGILGSMYIQDTFKNIASAYTYEQSRRTLQLDAGKVHSENLAIKNAQLAQQDKHHIEDLGFKKWQVETTEAGANARAALKASNTTSGVGVGSDGNINYETGVNVETEEQKRARLVQADNVDIKIASAANEQTKIITDLFNKTGGADYVKYLSEFEYADGRPGFSQQDLALAQPLMVGKSVLDPNYTKALEYFRNVNDLLTQASTGANPTALSNINFNVPEVLSSIKQLSTYDVEQKHLEKVKKDGIRTGLSHIIAQSSLSDTEKESLSPFIDNMYNYFDNSGKPRNEEAARMVPLLKKAGIYGKTLLEKIEGVSMVNVSGGGALRFNDIAKIANEQYYNKPENNVNINIPNNVYINYKNIDKTNSSLKAFAATGGLNADNKKETGNIDVNKIEILNVRPLPSYERQGSGVAEIEFQYEDANKVIHRGIKTANESQMKEVGIPVVPALEAKRNEVLWSTGSLPPNYKQISNWENGTNMIKTQIRLNSARQIEIIITDANGDIKLKKNSDGQYFNASYEAESFINSFLNNIGNASREDVMSYLRNTSIYN